MRILLLVPYYLPFPKSCAQMIHDLALEFNELGHNIIIGSPDENIREKFNITGKEDFQILRVNCGTMEAATKIKRAINEWRLSSLFLKYGKELFQKNPCDLIIHYSPTIFFSTMVKKLKKQWGCKSYLILRDIFPQWAVDAGVLKINSLPYRFFRYKEIQQHKAADVIGVQSPANLGYFHQNGWDNKYRLEVLFNWKRIPADKVEGHAFRKKLGLENKIIFFYGGNIGVAQDMPNILRLAESLLHRSDACFVLVGEGSEVNNVKRSVKERNLINVHVLPSVNQDEYIRMVNESDIGLMSLDRNLQTQNFPGKMLDYMLFSKPILASINPGNDLKTVMEEGNAALISTNRDDNKFRTDAIRLLDNVEERNKLGQNARRILERRFSATSAAKQILESVGS